MGGVLNERAVDRFAAANDLGLEFGLLQENRRLRSELVNREAELRAAETQVRLAADRERERIERNLHDGAQQQLLSLAVDLRTAAARAVRDPLAAPELLERAADDVAQVLRELRDLSTGARPQILIDHGLASAIERLAESSAATVQLGELPKRRLSEPLECAAYFVISEALANVIKHARASTVDVSAAVRGEHLVIEVRDDGIGGTPLRSKQGTGLRGLRERTQALGGTFDVVSLVAGGTLVHAVLPIGHAADPNPNDPREPAETVGRN